MNELQFVQLSKGGKSTCMCCGIDQHLNDTLKPRVVPLVKSEATGRILCPACHLAENWLEHSDSLKGTMLLTRSPQAYISMNFYMRQILRKDEAASGSVFGKYIKDISSRLESESTSTLTKHFTNIASELNHPETLAKINKVSKIKPSLMELICYQPHPDDFSLFNLPGETTGESTLETLITNTLFYSHWRNQEVTLLQALISVHETVATQVFIK